MDDTLVMTTGEADAKAYREVMQLAKTRSEQVPYAFHTICQYSRKQGIASKHLTLRIRNSTWWCPPSGGCPCAFESLEGALLETALGPRS